MMTKSTFFQIDYSNLYRKKDEIIFIQIKGLLTCKKGAIYLLKNSVCLHFACMKKEVILYKKRMWK